MKTITSVLLLFTVFPLFAQISFTDFAAQAGLNTTGKNYGVALADYDNDGWEDIYISRHSAPNQLYRNNGDGTFTDVGTEAGVAYAGTTNISIWGDVDNDGHLDLYLGNRNEPNILYHNNGDGTFTDISATAGVNDVQHARAVMFGDIDNDGFIDLYVANLFAGNKLYHNNGDGTFTDIVQQAGADDTQIAMGSILFDYDNDGDPDIYLVHDANQPNILYRNDGNNQFTNVSAASNTNYAGNGMGVDVGDVNNDGWLDIYITNLYPNTLLLNNGDGTFSDISSAAGATDVGMGWGTIWLDCDNDGWQDIYLANDSYFAPYPNILYRNLGDNTFEIISEGTVLESMYGGYGLATGDLNNDGRADMVLANFGSNDGMQLFLNQTQNEHHWVKVKTRGTTSNRAGIGARVEVLAGGQMHADEVISGASYAAMNSLTLHFGLGDATMIDELRLRWPSGLEEVYYDLEVDRSYIVTEGEGTATSVRNRGLSTALPVRISPNPFREETSLFFELSRPQQVTVTLFDLQGRPVITPVDGILGAGPRQIDLTRLSGIQPGVYLVSIRTEEGALTQKVVKIQSR